MAVRLMTGLLCVLLAVVSASSAMDPGRGLGGTGLTADDGSSGIGGTGYQPSGDGRGIGGTGIVGTIRAFGSIWVNGLEVHYWEDQPVTIYDRPATPKDLRLGQVVALEAQPQAGRMVASSIEVRHAVVGPVSAIDARAGTLRVLGQQVRLPPGGPLNKDLRRGDWVAVSGLRDPSGVVVASLLDRPPQEVGALVRGEVERVDSDGCVIGGRRYPFPPAATPSAVTVGTDLTLYGDPDGDSLRPHRMRLGWDLPFGGRVRNFLVEGFVAAGGRRVGALRLPDTAYRPKAGERVVVQGRFGVDGSLEERSLRVLSAPSGLDRLRLRLEDLQGELGTGQPFAPQRAMERTGPFGPYRSGAMTLDRPVGLAPPAENAEGSGSNGVGLSPWRREAWPAPAQGWLGADPLDPGYPGMSSGSPGLGAPASGISGAAGAPGVPGGVGGAGGSAAPAGRGGR